MSTQHSVSTPRTRLSSSCSSAVSICTLLSLGCVTEATPTTADPEPTTASAVASAPTPAPLAPAPAPVAEPEPPPAPLAPNAQPATLQLAFHGHCKHLGVSTIDDAQLVVHYDDGGRAKRFGDRVAWLHRMDEHGAIADSLAFPAWHHGDAEGSFAIGRVFGRWPEGLRVLAEMRGREGTDGRLHRRVGDQWKQIETLGASTDIDDAWPWVDGSILALGELGGDDRYDSRLGVVLGKGKGPSLAKLRRASKCKDGQFHVSDAAVLPNGTIVAVGGCEGGTWVGTWPPGDLEGTAKRVTDAAFHWSELHLDDEGNGFVQVQDTLVRWQDGVATPVEIPGRPKANDTTIVTARPDHAWYARGTELWRWAPAGWEAVPTPEGRKIDWAAGLGFGTPWLLFKDGTLAMQTADGSWHDVPLAPTPDLDETPKAALLYVTAPGEAWVEAKYTKYRKGSKTVGAKLRALYTTRDAPLALSCGKGETSREPAGASDEPTPAPAPAGT